MTFAFIGLSLCVYGYFIYQTSAGVTNMWIFMSGALLWMLAVANAKINELCNKKD